MPSIRILALFCGLFCLAADGTAAPSHAWSARFGGTSNDVARGVAVDASGNVYLTGLFSGSADFGGGPLASAGGTDIFVAKYDAGGAHQWSRVFGAGGADAGRGIAVDGGGNVVVTGYFAGVVNFGGGDLASVGGADAFIARFDTDGNHLWSRQIGSTGADNGLAVATDALGNLVATGFFSGTAEFATAGPGSVTHASAGSTDGFVASYSAAGAHQWSRTFGGTGADEGMAVCLDWTAIVVGGDFTGTAMFDAPSGLLTSAGATDMCVVRYDASGFVLSSQRYGGTAGDYCYALAPVPGGGYALGGGFSASIDLGGGPLSSAGGQDILVAKFTSAAAHLWSRATGSAGDDYALAVGASGPGAVVASGAFQGTVDLGAGAVASNGVHDVFIAMYDAGGACQWAQVGGSVSSDQGYAVAVDGPGNIVAAGYFRTLINLGGADLNEIGGQDVFLAKYATAASPVGPIVKSAGLAQNVPNPFNPRTTIRYDLPEPGLVRLSIFDVAGRHVRTLVDESRPPGSHEAVWDGRDASGREAGSGTYLARLECGGRVKTVRMGLVR